MRMSVHSPPRTGYLDRSCSGAADSARRNRDRAQARNLERRFLDRLEGVEQVAVNSDRTHCVAGIVNLGFAGVESESLMVALPDVAFSTGSACMSARVEPSYVLRAPGLDDDSAHGSLRFSFGRFTTAKQIDHAAERLRDAVKTLVSTRRAKMIASGLSGPVWEQRSHRQGAACCRTNLAGLVAKSTEERTELELASLVWNRRNCPTMTIPDAAKKVLLEAGEPLSINDIYDRIIGLQLYDFKARDPRSVLRSAIRSRADNINNPSSKSIRLFRLVDGGRFLALVSPIDARHSGSAVRRSERSEHKTEAQVERVGYATLKKQVDAYNAGCREDLLQFLQQLNWEDFERFASQLLRVYGFEDVKVTRPNSDGGIDGHGRLKVGLAHMNVAFQCKRWTAKTIGRGKVDEFRRKFQRPIFRNP